MADETPIDVRVEMIDGTFALDDATLTYMNVVRKALGEAMEKIKAARPSTCSYGGFMNGIAKMQEAKNTLCDAGIIGKEEDTRKKRKVEAQRVK